MDDKQFRELRTLIQEQGMKIAELTMVVRQLKQAVETTEIVYLGPDDAAFEEVDVPEDLKKFLPD